MKDPQHTGVGFFDRNDVESIIRAIRDDAGMRLYNSIKVSKGEMEASAQVERDLHNQILLKHDYVTPFATIQELVTFITDYKPRDEAGETMQALLLHRLPSI